MIQQSCLVCLDSVSPDEDSESVCSSLDGCSVVSEDAALSIPPSEEDTEEDLEFRLAELIDQLADKKYDQVVPKRLNYIM